LLPPPPPPGDVGRKSFGIHERAFCSAYDKHKQAYRCEALALEMSFVPLGRQMTKTVPTMHST